MILNELHVFQRDSGSIGRGHPIPGVDRGVGGEWEDATTSSGAEDNSLAGNDFYLARVKIDRCNATYFTIVDQ